MITDISYKTGTGLSDYEQRRCKLDIYLPPASAEGAPADVLIWFYGGGLEEGSREGEANQAVARALADEGLLVVMPDYRLYPLACYPAHNEDAAAAVAWAYRHCAHYGGNPNRLFIGGHSAGGYLAAIVGLHPGYLAAAGVPAGAVAGLIPVSGQTMTHHAIRAERGLSLYELIADDAAPVRWARAEAPPVLAMYADQDMPTRAEEIEFLVALLRAAGHANATALRIADRDHGSVGDNIANAGDAARLALLEFVRTATR